MRTCFQLFFIVFSFFCFGQKDTNWYAFYNQDSTKIGFKDAEGKIKIEPKFETYITSYVFKNVIAAVEIDSNENFLSYFLNKIGKKFGENAVYMAGTSDVAEDSVEQNGIIKFKNPATGNVGFYDHNGKIVIPDIYNDITNFHYGIARALKGATWPGCNAALNDCEHLWWEGGNVFALNMKGEELFELPEIYSSEIDYKNPVINKKVDADIYISNIGKDGNTYSFINPEKDFNKWFQTQFLPDFKKTQSVNSKYFYDLISVSDNDNPTERTAWKNHEKGEYLKKNQLKIDGIFKNLISAVFKENTIWESGMNYSYFPENKLPKQDLSENTVISFYCRAENDYSSANNFQFTKIGEGFFITSAP